jgi:hypothetical protein
MRPSQAIVAERFAGGINHFAEGPSHGLARFLPGLGL